VRLNFVHVELIIAARINTRHQDVTSPNGHSQHSDAPHRNFAYSNDVYVMVNATKVQRKKKDWHHTRGRKKTSRSDGMISDGGVNCAAPTDGL
jgi:hypothetical protein